MVTYTPGDYTKAHVTRPDDVHTVDDIAALLRAADYLEGLD